MNLQEIFDRTAPTYEVERGGDDNTAIGVANGIIVGAEALSPKVGNTSAVLH